MNPTRTNRFSVLIALTCGLATAQTGTGANLSTNDKTYVCRYATGPIVLDGRLDEPAWQTAARVEQFQLFRPAGSSYPHHTVGRLTWDDEHLYVSFACGDDDVRSASTQHDDYLAAGDVVELYIKYDDEHPQYYEMVSAPNGTTFDARWPHRGAGDFKQFTPWESGLKSASTVLGTADQSDDTDEGFVVEMAVPWAAFDGVAGPPAEGTAWTFGLFRYDHSARFNEPHLLMSLDRSPEHGFHYYEAYHPIVFKRSGNVTLDSPDGLPVLGLYGGAGNDSFDKAVELGFDWIFPAVNWHTDHDWMKLKVEMAHEHGIKVCPSYGVAYDGHGEEPTAFAAAHPEWWEVRRNGTQTSRGYHVGLSFGVPEVRAHKVNVLAGRVRDYGLDGIMLDYTRMFERTCGYHPVIVEAFKEKTGRDPHQLSLEDPAWIKFRAGYVTRFVRELREAVDRIGVERSRPVELLACVNSDPAKSLKGTMQDWQTWVDEGLIDGVVSMVYHHNPNETLRQVQIANAACRGKVWHMPMIAPYDWFLTTDELVLDASLKCLKTGTGAVAYYRDDYIFKYELWDAIEQVGQWTDADIAALPINYLQNPGFELGMENWAVGSGENVERVEIGQAGAVRFAGPGALRQIIDRGLMGRGGNLQASMRVRADAVPGDAAMFLDISVNRGNGDETYFRVPVSLSADGQWHPFSVSLPIDDTGDINWLMAGVVTAGTGLDVMIDDLAIGFEAAAPESAADYAISAGEAAQNWRPGDNLARGQCVVGSSFWEKGFEYDNAVDGEVTSESGYTRGVAWHSQRPAENQWIMVALPAPRRIDKVRILNAFVEKAYRTHKFRVGLSLDGQRFDPVAEGLLPDDGVTWTEQTFPAQRAKYLRFTGVTGFVREYAVGVGEIEVFGPDTTSSQ